MSYHSEKLLEQIARDTKKILRLLGDLGEREIQMANELDALTSQVKANTDAEQSAIVLLEGLKKSLDDAIASGDPNKLKELSNALGTSQAALAKAIVDNTPTPTPPPMPPSQTSGKKHP